MNPHAYRNLRRRKRDYAEAYERGQADALAGKGYRNNESTEEGFLGYDAGYSEHKQMEISKMEATDVQTMDSIDPYPAPRSKPLAEILRDLRQPIPKKYLRKKDAGKYKVDYVQHTTIRDLLDYYAPGWEWKTSLWSVDGKVYVTGTLTLHGSDGSISRDGIGNEDSDLDSWGDPSSNSDAQALRRAAMAHGLGRDLWRKK